MLNNLLKALKSEKSSQGVILENKQKKSSQSAPGQYQIDKYQISTLLMEDKARQVHGSIKRIRYYILPDLPNIFNQVLGCPISVFHFLPHGQRKVKEIDLKIHQFPHYLDFLKPFLQRQVPTFNHVLINDYMPSVGIMPHSDGPAYLPKVFVLSLNGYTVINFQKCYNNGQQKISFNSRILLQPNSIHIFEEEAYNQYLHGIENYPIDSILIRYDKNEKKVTKANIDNYQLLGCRLRIEEQIRKEQMQSQFDEIRLVRLQGNQQYTHKIEITRKQRVSITIRHKYNV